MNFKMKVLGYQQLVKLNESSIHSNRKQNIAPDQLPADYTGPYIVNFRFDHKSGEISDVRLSVILKPGVLSAWLDVSQEEYDSIPEKELSELDWEAAICVGIPRWKE